MKRSFLALTVLLCSAAEAQVIQTIAGGGSSDGRPATEIELAGPVAVTLDEAGNLYFVEGLLHRVRRVDAATGVIATVAGSGGAGFSGDGGPAVLASLHDPIGIDVDSAGNLYIADVSNNRVRWVEKTGGTIATVAGGGPRGAPLQNGIPAMLATLDGPIDVAVDSAGNLYIVDGLHHQIRRVEKSSQMISAFAGNGISGFMGDSGRADQARLSFPAAIDIDSAGDFLIADRNNQRIRRVARATGTISTVAGNGTAGFAGDQGPATVASINYPFDVVADAFGAFYIADSENARIRRVDNATQTITTFAGTGAGGFSGDGGPAASAQISYFVRLAADAAGNLYLADASNHRVRRIDRLTGVITTVAGALVNAGPAAESILVEPFGVAFDRKGNVYIADTFHHRIRRVDAVTKEITTVAGTGDFGFSGDGGPATSAKLNSPYAVAVDGHGSLFISDSTNARIRKVDVLTGTITTIAGTGSVGFSGDGGPATQATMGEPYAIAIDAAGNVFFADAFNSRVRRVDAATNVITSVAETAFVQGIGLDAAGNLFIADERDRRVLRMDAATGAITTMLSDPNVVPRYLAVDRSGNLFIADHQNSRILRLDAKTRVVTTVAGTGQDGFLGDGGLATSAMINRPSGLAVDVWGNIAFADTGNNRVRMVYRNKRRHSAAH